MGDGDLSCLVLRAVGVLLLPRRCSRGGDLRPPRDDRRRVRAGLGVAGRVGQEPDAGRRCLACGEPLLLPLFRTCAGRSVRERWAGPDSVACPAAGRGEPVLQPVADHGRDGASRQRRCVGGHHRPDEPDRGFLARDRRASVAPACTVGANIRRHRPRCRRRSLSPLILLVLLVLLVLSPAPHNAPPDPAPPLARPARAHDTAFASCVSPLPRHCLCLVCFTANNVNISRWWC